MKKILVIGSFMLLAMVSFATGPVLKDCDAASATVSQSVEMVISMPAIIPQAVVFYELPLSGIIPELGTPLQSAMLTGYSADIWHPPVVSTSWLNFNTNYLTCSLPVDGNAQNCRSDKLLNPDQTYGNKVFHICWFDIA